MYLKACIFSINWCMRAHLTHVFHKLVLFLKCLFITTNIIIEQQNKNIIALFEKKIISRRKWLINNLVHSASIPVETEKNMEWDIF